MQRRIIIAALTLVGLFLVTGVNGGTVNDQAETTFIVRWYDVGVTALAGRSGVLSVEKGWQGRSEINRVVYDPEKITVEQLETLLKKSGTYVRTVDAP